MVSRRDPTVTASMIPTAPVLGSLIGDHSIERFFTEHWERSHLLVRLARNPGMDVAAQQLFGFDHADRLLTTPGPRFRDFVRMSRGGDPLPRETYSSPRGDGLVDYDFDHILELYEHGATVTLNRAQQGSDALADLCADLAAELRAHVNANVYITPPRAQGFAAHPDTHDVFLIQVVGSKRWRVQAELEYLATSRDRNRVSDPSQSEGWVEFDLEPGDILYLPRGLMHAGETDLSHSLHITVGIHPYTWADAIRDTLADLEREHEPLRRSATAGRDGFDEALAAVTTSFASRMADPEAMGETILHATADQIRGSERGRFRRLTDPERIGLGTRVRKRSGVRADLRTTEAEVVVVVGTRSISLPGYVEEHARMVTAGGVTSAEALPPSLDEAGRLVLARTLVAEGVLEVV